MTESDWNTCTDPQPMLEFLHGKVSDRKLRLFACACCRRIWHLLTDERSRRAVDLAEKAADHPISPQALDAVSAEAEEAFEDIITNDLDEVVRDSGLTWNHLASAYTAASYASNDYLTDANILEVTQSAAAANLESVKETRTQAALFVDIVGNPFRPIECGPHYLTPTVVSLAQAIYDERAFDRMPILADSLEEAGCTDRLIIEHCRSGGDHVRGCWVVDLILGKE